MYAHPHSGTYTTNMKEIVILLIQGTHDKLQTHVLIKLIYYVPLSHLPALLGNPASGITFNIFQCPEQCQTVDIWFLNQPQK